ncbi:zinc finger protein ZXDC-like [Limulus polyphemus]|uniref:Zinc finger protein ZXDC-like n=1 Tax=Limulus polyphemus TaxID=6850 RepID=A0ABM1BJV2_LIMPO|nr:zinc finger protein ZXDC-like [Limulus polyphemus]
MAVFFMNVCKFNACGLTFPTLKELIQHIEETHIDFDPSLVEKQELQHPSSLPISYILRVFTETGKKETINEPKKKMQMQSPSSSLNSTPPTGSEVEDEEMMSGSEDSNDSWAKQDEFMSEFILRVILYRMIGSSNTGEGRPFACPVAGCKKRYKNLNGIKYHAKNGHKKEGKPKKTYKCQCGKTYMTPQGLKNHYLMHHTGSSTTPSLSSSKDRTLASIVNSPATMALLTQGQSVQTATILTPSHGHQSNSSITNQNTKLKQVLQASADHEMASVTGSQKSMILQQCLKRGEVGSEMKTDPSSLVVLRKSDNTTCFSSNSEATLANHNTTSSIIVKPTITWAETSQIEIGQNATPLTQSFEESQLHTPDSTKQQTLNLPTNLPPTPQTPSMTLSTPKLPPISPTLQQHLLSPITPTKNSQFAIQSLNPATG